MISDMIEGYKYQPRTIEMVKRRMEEYRLMESEGALVEPPYEDDEPQQEPPRQEIPIKIDPLPKVQQENLITLLIWHDESALTIRSQVEPNLFDSIHYRIIVTRAIEYIDAYHEAPKYHIVDILDKELSHPDTRRANVYKEILLNMDNVKDSINRKYVLDNLSHFLKTQVLKHSIIEAGRMLNLEKSDSLGKGEVIIQKALEYMPSEAVDDEIMYTDLAIKDDEEVYTFLPLFGHKQWFIKRWSHIVSAYPKTGKTEMLIRVITEWPDETILYFTEEAKDVWKARWEMLPDQYKHHPHIKLVFSRDKKPAEIMQRVRPARETIIIIDTVNELLGIEDESDNPEIRRVLRPYINVCNKNKQTFIGLNHDRKSGGSHGKAVSGGAAFVGAVDKIIEMDYAGEPDSSQRLMTSVGRIFETKPLIYELQNYVAVPQGSPRDVSLKAVKEKTLEYLNDDWKVTSLIISEVKAS